jgi:hypothetical protein
VRARRREAGEAREHDDEDEQAAEVAHGIAIGRNRPSL